MSRNESSVEKRDSVALMTSADKNVLRGVREGNHWGKTGRRQVLEFATEQDQMWWNRGLF